MAIITINELNKTTKLTNVNETMPIIALIGPATYGPVNTPTELYNVDDFNSTFGGTLCKNYPYAAIAAKRYLSSQGMVLYTRIATEAVTAAYTVDNMLSVTANYPGTFGNSIKISIDPLLLGGLNHIKINTFIDNVIVDFRTFSLQELKDVGSLELDYITVTALEGLTADSVISAVDIVSLTGGSDGDKFFTEEDNYQDEYNNLIKTLDPIITQLSDPQIYEFAIIAIPGISGLKNMEANIADLQNGESVIKQMVSLTEARKDCVAVIDPLVDSTYNNVLTDLMLDDISSSYIAIFYPWYNAAITDLNATILMPPSVFYLDGCATSFKINKPWNAVAGPLTGTCTNCTRTIIKVGSQMSRSLNNMFINPIVYNRNFGYYIDGNNVLNAAANTRTYSQLGIRQGINYAKRELTKLCHIMSYKQNSSLVRSEVLGRVSKLLEGLKAGEAIYGYRAYINESAMDMADGIIRLTVKIYPTPALEEFVFDFEIVNSESALNE